MSKSLAMFPTTGASLRQLLASQDPADRARALELVAHNYWRPFRRYAMARWRRSEWDAQDLTQQFFESFLSRETLERFDPQRGRFRTFLRVCLDRFIADRDRHDRALKRGGDLTVANIDEIDPAASIEDPARLLDTEWVRHVLAVGCERLTTELMRRNKLEHLRVFELLRLDSERAPPSYAEIGQTVGLDLTTITNRISYVRRAFRRITMAYVREVTVTDEEYRNEVIDLFGGDVLP